MEIAATAPVSINEKLHQYYYLSFSNATVICNMYYITLILQNKK